jgi:protein-S-isoprenylcysteine O-methyltransferase Ste14
MARTLSLCRVHGETAQCAYATGALGTLVGAVTQAAEEARAGAPAPAAGSLTGVGAACLLSAAGLLSLAIAVLVRPQTGGGLVHAGALVLRVVYGATGIVIVLIGAVLLYRAWHNRRAAAAAS